MSDNIPLDIQEEIIKILPIKSLLRLKSVSKHWKSLIESSKFIAEYHTQQKHKHHLLVSYQTFDRYSDDKYVSIVDDESFPQHKLSLTIPESVKILRGPVIVSSQGLFFLHRYHAYLDCTKDVIIWNPTIRQSVNIDMSGVCSAFFGFGVCPDTCDPKIVKLPYNRDSIKRDTTFDVFTLSTNSWRRLSNKLPRECISFTHNQVAIHRFMYWLAQEPIYEDDGYYEEDGYYEDDRYQSWYERNLIVSFDMTGEEFTEINLPDSLEANTLRIYNIGESLGVVQIYKIWESLGMDQVYSVWKMMEHGVSKLFTKLYTINTRVDVITDVYGFRKSGEPIAADDNNDDIYLYAYDPDSELLNYIGIYGTRLSVGSYFETLLLHDQ